MQLCVLTSKSLLEQENDQELPALTEILGADNVVELFHDIPTGALVVPRFRAIPFGGIVEREITACGATIVNTFHEHSTIANTFAWGHLLDGSDGKKPLTSKTYTIEDIPYLPEGEWFVKGSTNSIKNNWLDCCYAPTTHDLLRVVGNVQKDVYVGTQDIVIKPFQHYRELAVGVNREPIFNERRAFFYKGELLVDGFYWSTWSNELGKIEYSRNNFMSTVADAISRVGDIAPFLVIDFAEYPDGTWGVVELNDGSMSGLSECDPYVLWNHFVEKLG